MKIESNGANSVQQADEAQQAERSSAARTPKEAHGASRSDRVDVSSDARLVSDALKAASDAPAIRQDAVERAKKKLESGELGSDPYKLADRIIDDLSK
ncbi:MAG: flagellar biosynthesis anti-sigma factor FlgM [Vicinamibacterales bacterium]